VRALGVEVHDDAALDHVDELVLVVHVVVAGIRVAPRELERVERAVAVHEEARGAAGVGAHDALVGADDGGAVRVLGRARLLRGRHQLDLARAERAGDALERHHARAGVPALQLAEERVRQLGERRQPHEGQALLATVRADPGADARRLRVEDGGVVPGAGCGSAGHGRPPVGERARRWRES
jgi:hypothetical protein